jgi:molybdopterin-guanine dinucleotide biosynthesis protein A
MTGVILAGGKSLRMGRDKAFLELGGTAVIERVISALGGITERLIIVTDDPLKYAGYGLETASDIYPGVGVLGGIHTGLSYMREDSGFFCACDMPFINPDLVKFIIEKRGRASAAVPRVGGELEPLFAVYSKNCLKPAEDAIKAGEKRIISFFDNIKVKEIPEAEIKSIDPDLLSFMNLNTPEDLKRAGAIVEGSEK